MSLPGLLFEPPQVVVGVKRCIVKVGRGVGGFQIFQHHHLFFIVYGEHRRSSFRCVFDDRLNGFCKLYAG